MERGSRTFFAHSLPGRPQAEWEPLEAHLRKVGDLAAEFAAPFGGAEWARLAGLWHDLGKYSEAFQDYLRSSSEVDPHAADPRPKTDHSTAGAQHSANTIEVLGHLLAFLISGHHSGLLDSIAEGASLEARLRKQVEDWSAAPRSLLDVTPPSLPEFLGRALSSGQGAPFAFALWTRMLFSCLVDADFLATEGFLNPEQTAERSVWPADVLQSMEVALAEYLSRFDVGALPINADRARVLEACRAAAPLPPGFFSLTVPTGGGKTLSSLAFALRHADHHGLRRIVYVAPFTTIIEQNARVFREALSGAMGEGRPDLVLEHHSNLGEENETTASRLATENWNAPLVVTTAVQFYESLFGNRTSQCRKLHRIANAVVILDEAQALPVDYLGPCLRVLRELVDHYGATVVLCTATQPAVERRSDFSIGLDGVREIVPEPVALYRALRRVEVFSLGRVLDVELVDRLTSEKQVLCVVNTRGHARALFDLLGQCEGLFHLSALMCPEHRSEVLERVRNRLAHGGTCRLISTQLVEAGVDIDFPVVYRSLAGVDSIAQAAGRCNRHGRLEGLGRTYVFESEHQTSERFLSDTASCSRQILPLHEDPLALETIEHYFRLYYWEQGARWDARKILDEFRLDRHRKALPFLFNFASAASRFRLIEDGGKPILVPWGKTGRDLCAELASPWRPAGVRLLRSLQRFSVQIPRRVWEEHRERSFTMVQERFAVLLGKPGDRASEGDAIRLGEQVLYSPQTGLRLPEIQAGAYFV